MSEQQIITYKGHCIEIDGPVKTKNDHPRWIVSIDGEQVYRSCLGGDHPFRIAKQLIDEGKV